MRRLIRAATASVCILVGLAGCLSMGRGQGPIDTFAFLAGTNKVLGADVVGAINERAEPKEIRVVVPAGTDLHGLVATLSLNKEAVITVISSGTRVVQQNGITVNDFSVPVTYALEIAGDKKPWSYKVFVRVADTNARLSMLLLPPGSLLRPPFNGAVHEYALEVPFATSSFRLGARGESPYLKSVSIDGAATPGAAATSVVDFTGVTERRVTVETLAEDGATRAQYTIDVQRGAPDTNAALDALDLQDISLVPSFTPSQQGYQALVPFSTARIVVHARPQSRVASVGLSAAQGSGGSAPLSFTGNPSDSAGAIVDLPPGPGTAIVVTVTAEDGTVQQYLVDVRRAPPDHNSDLASLSASAGALNPPFSPRAGVYSIALPAEVESVTVTAVAASPVASVFVIPRPGSAPAPGQSVVVPVPAGGSTQVAFAVRAEDGTQRVYRVQVTRALPPPDGNALLQSLQVTGAPIVPGFNPSVILYDARIPADVESVVVQPMAQSRFAAVAIDGQPVAGGGRVIVVPRGATRRVIIDVTAQDGTLIRTTLRVTRDAAPASPPPQGVGSGGAVQGGGQGAAPSDGGQPGGQGAGGAPQGGGQGPQPGAGPLPPPPPDTGRDRVFVTARNLRLGQREVAALQAAGDQVGTVAQITVRGYRSTEVITRYSAPVEVRAQGPNIAVSIDAPSNGVTLKRDRMVEVETAIRTRAGRFLSYTEAQQGDDKVQVDIPFLVYGTDPRVAWPAPGSPVAVGGYMSLLPAGKERASDKADFDRNPKGELAIAVEIVDARTNASYGKDSVLSRAGPRRDRVFSFGKAIQVPEGAAVRVVLSATARNGTVWTAAGQAQVWTTAMGYPSGFQPVILPIGDELAPAK